MNFNFVDFLVLFFLLFFLWQGYQTGFVAGLLNILSTVISFGAAILLYPDLASLFQSQFGWTENISFVLAFFTILIVIELVLSFIFHRLYSLATPIYRLISGFLIWDKIFGLIPSVLVGLFLVSLFLLLPLILPVKENIRDVVSQSWWGKNVLTKALVYQPQIEGLLNRLPYKNLAYLITPDPKSDKSVELSFPKEIKLIPDPKSEKAMFDFVNKERSKKGLNILVWDEELKKLARIHCLDMFEKGYFSHNSPDGRTPFVRMDNFGITYKAAGENLAYAPNVDIANEGLINSPGHRANILRPEFGTLGVGVIDGGINGKMFCQEFND